MIGLLDPSIDSGNAGDLIIRDSVDSVLAKLGLTSADYVVLPTQRSFTRSEREIAQRCEKLILGGTNILASHMMRYRQWRFGVRDYKALEGKVRLLGVGWWQYQNDADRFSSYVYTKLLDSAGHSVRDEDTRKKLAAMGISSLNTTCPTLWNLAANPESSKSKAQRVVVTLTDYNRKTEPDRRLLEFLKSQYKTVVAWPQGRNDAKYIASLDSELPILDGGLQSFDHAIRTGSDYVGTRLHAGVRALQLGARATIVLIDNRATEIGRETGLATVSRVLSDRDRELIVADRSLNIMLPTSSIDEWIHITQEWLSA